MPYTNTDKVKKRARKALSPDDDPDFLDEIIAEGIEYADSRIDSALSTRYSVPFDVTPSAVEQIASDLAAYFALVEVYSGGADNEPTLLANALRDRAEKWLMELANGDTTLPATGGGGETSDPTKPKVWTNKTASQAAIENFDLVNRPCGNAIPFAPFQRRGR